MVEVPLYLVVRTFAYEGETPYLITSEREKAIEFAQNHRQRFGGALSEDQYAVYQVQDGIEFDLGNDSFWDESKKPIFTC